MIKAVIFDLDDTLYGYEALDKEARMRVRALVCGELGIAAEDYEEAYAYGRGETKREHPTTDCCTVRRRWNIWG